MAELAISTLDTTFEEEKRKTLLEVHPWMNSFKFTLLTKRIEIQAYIDKAIAVGECSVDFETEGLNTRLREDGTPYHDIVGVCLCCDDYEGVYIPVGHEYDRELNVSKKFVIQELSRLVKNTITIYHNFKFDGSILRNNGIEINDFKRYDDTILMVSVEDASRKGKGLKDLSESILNRPMIEIKDLLGKDQPISFKHVPIRLAVYYGGGDSLNTYALKKHFTNKLNEQDPDRRQGLWTIYEIEKKAQFVVMEMERNLVKIDVPYLKTLKYEQETKRDILRNKILEKVGKPFDIDSPKQLGHILFEHLAIPYPKDAEKTKTGLWQTDEKVLSKLSGKLEVVNWILEYRGIQKLIGTYIENFIKNADKNGCVKFQLNQTRADTGRFSASGGYGLLEDGYSGVNCQNISASQAGSPDLRKGIVARDGFKIVAIDYSGEELRIATNLSNEPKWVNEFLHGTGDIHSITTRDVYDTSEEKMTKEKWKELRGIGKQINFLTIYGGGANRFSAVANVPIDKAQMMLIKFFRSLPTLKKWIDGEKIRSRKRGYSMTAFGRRRSLAHLYNSGDPRLIKSADRQAVNSAVQGAGADILKIALYRVWKWIHENNFEDKVKILFPVHDEIVFEIKSDELDFFIPQISDIMKLDDVVKKGLKWKVGFEVDAEYGDTWHTDRNFFEELKKQKDHSAAVPVKKEETKVEAPAVVPVEVEKEDYHILNVEKVTKDYADRLKKIMKLLIKSDSEVDTPKKRVKVINAKGESHVLRNALSADGYKALLFIIKNKELI